MMWRDLTDIERDDIEQWLDGGLSRDVLTPNAQKYIDQHEGSQS
jgi:hypothetical protein